MTEANIELAKHLFWFAWLLAAVWLIEPAPGRQLAGVVLLLIGWLIHGWRR